MNVANIPQAEKKYILSDILKKRRHEQSLGAERVRRIKEKREQRKQKKDDFLHPEHFIKKYRKQQKAFAYIKTKTNKVLNQPVIEANDKLFDVPLNKTLLVVRIRGLDDISDKQSKILKLIRLKKIDSCVFLKSTPKNIQLLKRVENYITYGIPSRQTVNMLIFKRAHTFKDQQIVPVTTNQLVEDALSDKNIICIEDLVEEISRTGPNFEVVSKFLCPFRLNHPKSGLKSGQIKKPISKGGEWGYREEKINQLIESMI